MEQKSENEYHHHYCHHHYHHHHHHNHHHHQFNLNCDLAKHVYHRPVGALSHILHVYYQETLLNPNP